jgi:Cu/Ag efflux pump CusA
MDTGGRTLELSEFEFMVRGRGYLGGTEDIGAIALRSMNGVPLLLRDVARVEIVPDERRGIAELDGEGEVASGTVLQRVTLALIFLLLYLNFRRLTETLIVMLSLPFSLVGGIWLMWFMGFNMSVAVAVGFIALAGLAAETGVIMLIYLDHAWAEARAAVAREGRTPARKDLYAAIMVGAVDRVRPKIMTVVAIMAGLMPILWADGTGSEIMQRIAVPMIGGMVSSTLLTLIVIPGVYGIVKWWPLPRNLDHLQRCPQAALLRSP